MPRWGGLSRLPRMRSATRWASLSRLPRMRTATSNVCPCDFRAPRIAREHSRSGVQASGCRDRLRFLVLAALRAECIRHQSGAWVPAVRALIAGAAELATDQVGQMPECRGKRGVEKRVGEKPRPDWNQRNSLVPLAAGANAEPPGGARVIILDDRCHWRIVVLQPYVFPPGFPAQRLERPS
jgi:hypothetical protein